MSEKVNIVLGVTGSVAVFKSAELVSQLVKDGKDVDVIMTEAATKFVSPLTFQSLTKRRVYTEMFDEIIYEDIRHISLAQRASLFVIAPATANIIGKIANGIADDMLSTVVMATRAPVLICPAMNTAMYENPIVQANIAKLKAYGYIFIEPKEARLACGDVGRGAMADVSVIFDAIKSLSGGKIAKTPPPLRYDSPEYSLDDVEQHLKDPHVALLFERVEKILGKLLKDNERQMYLGFYDDLAMPVELIVFMLEYCLERGKKGSSYLRTVAQNWVEQGIDTVEAAQEYVRLFNNEFRDILRAFGVSGRDPIAKEVQYMNRWLKDDAFPLQIIKLACEKAIMNKATVNFSYADGILNKWKEGNIQTIEQVEALEKAYYDNANNWKRPMQKQQSSGAKKFQNYKGRKWDYDKLAKLELTYVDKEGVE